MIPTPRGPDIPPPPPPLPGPGGREPSPAFLAYKAWEDLEELKKEFRALVARFEALERRVAAVEDAKTARPAGGRGA
jgi:hypothetical protein